MNNQTHNVNHVNHVKFTGSAFESPSDAVTLLLQCVLLLLLIFGIQPDPRN
jgi:hypothetical protein